MQVDRYRSRPDRAKQVLRLGAFGLGAFAVLIAAGMGLGSWAYASAILHPGCQGDRPGLDVRGFPSQAVTFDSQDGTTRRGWYTPGETHPDVAVIVVPGHASNTAFAINDAAIFAGAGYSTLIYEHRSCADPHLSASTGIYEAQDVVGASQFLQSLPEITHIVAFGFSEGGTAVLLAAASDPGIEAVIAVGGYASLTDDTLDPPPDSQSVPEQVFRRMVLWSLDFQLGLRSDGPSPIQAIHEISPRPVFLIYGDSEQLIGNALYEEAEAPKTLWLVPGATHGSYANAAPEDYPKRLLEFLAAAVPHDSP